MTPQEAIAEAIFDNRVSPPPDWEQCQVIARAALDVLEAERFAIYRPDDCKAGFVIGTSDGPRHDQHHPMNAPYGAWVAMTMDDNEAPALSRYRLIPEGESS